MDVDVATNTTRRRRRLAVAVAIAVLAWVVVVVCVVILRDDGDGTIASLRVIGIARSGQATGNVVTEDGQLWFVCAPIPLPGGTVIDGVIHADGSSPVSTGGILPTGTFVGGGIELELAAVGPTLPCGAP